MPLSNFNLIATAPGGVARLRELVLTLAVQGKLVPQDPADEPASVLLEKIRAEKARRVAAGEMRRDKPLAEIAEEEKAFELPAGWEWARLGDVFTLEYGAALPEKSRAPGEIPVFGSNGIVGFHNIPFINNAALIIGRKGSVGAINISEQPCWPIDTSYYVIPPLDCVDIKFSFYLLKSLHLELHDKATAIPGLNRNDAYHEIIGLPPLAEQARIVARVDELMRLCDALEETGRLQAAQHAQLLAALLGTLTASSSAPELAAQWQRVARHFDLLLDRPEAVDALEQTLLHLAVRGLLVPQDPADEPASALLARIRAEKERLAAEGKIRKEKPLPPIDDAEKPFELPAGWEWANLKSVVQKIGSGSTPRGGKEVYTKTGIKFLRSQNVWNTGLVLANVAFIPPETHARMSGTVVYPKDILFNITGASIGRCAIVPDEFDEANVSQHVSIIRAVVSDSVKFLHLALISELVQEAVMKVQVGVSREGLSVAKLGNFWIPIPPLPEQARIVARVTELRRLCAQLRERLASSQQAQRSFAEACVGQWSA